MEMTVARDRVVRSAVQLYRHPGWFYGLSVAIPWALWLIAGALSRTPHPTPATAAASAAIALLGLCAPVAVAAALATRDPQLRHDMVARLNPFRSTSPLTLALAVGVLPAAMLAATAISVLLGYPTSQFMLKTTSSIGVGALPGWFIIGFAPVVEELAWHSYGTDCLVSRWTVWRSTLVFGVFWACWHIPLATIKGSYQAEVTDVGWLASANFLLSVFPLMILMNWLYFKSDRNTWVAVLVHLSANYGNELLQTHPDTKVIQTAVLLIPCAWVLWHDRALFFSRPSSSVRSPVESTSRAHES